MSFMKMDVCYFVCWTDELSSEDSYVSDEISDEDYEISDEDDDVSDVDYEEKPITHETKNKSISKEKSKKNGQSLKF